MEAALRVVGKVVRAGTKYVADLVKTVAGLVGGLLRAKRVKAVKDLYSKVWEMATKWFKRGLS